MELSCTCRRASPVRTASGCARHTTSRLGTEHGRARGNGRARLTGDRQERHPRRLPEFAGKQYLTAGEAAEHQKRVLEAVGSRQPRRRPPRGSRTGVRRARGGTRTRRSSRSPERRLIVDPPDGEASTPHADAQKRIDDARVERQRRPADGPEDRPLMDRCLWWPAVGPPMLPASPTIRRIPAGEQLSVPAGARVRRDRQRDPPRDAPHSAGRTPASSRRKSANGWGTARPVGGKHARRRHDEFTGEVRASGENLHQPWCQRPVDTLIYESTVDDPSPTSGRGPHGSPHVPESGPIFEERVSRGELRALAFLLGMDGSRNGTPGRAPEGRPARPTQSARHPIRVGDGLRDRPAMTGSLQD